MIALVAMLLLSIIGAGIVAATVGLPFVDGGGTASAEPCVINASSTQSDETWMDDDCDGLANETETRFGLDPQAADTDDDGVDDRAELYILSTDPKNPDTDGDGVLDGAEDPDGDGLTHAEEIEAGSHPTAVDGDRDGITDPEERFLGTEPLLADSDDDRLDDDEELDLGTDPLDPDTDGDGVIDGNETYTTSVANDGLNAEVIFNGRGNVAADASLRNETRFNLRNDLVDPARATEFVRLEAQDSFDSATITFTYDESAVPRDEDDLAVYRLNRTIQFYEPVHSTIDPANNTITGRIDQTGVYVVFSPTVLAEQFTVDRNPGTT